MKLRDASICMLQYVLSGCFDTPIIQLLYCIAIVYIMCVCVRVCVCVCVCACVCVRACACVCIHTYILTIHVDVHTSACLYADMNR